MKNLKIKNGCIIEADYNLTEINIPYGVTCIGEFSFNGFKNLKKITFPETLKTIEQCAFKECENLKEIVFPDSLIKIGDGAFKYCEKLSNIKFGKSLNYIGYNSFAYCAISKIEFPDTLIEITSGAFSYCSNLSNIKFGNCLKSIGIFAFGNCSKLTEILIPQSCEIIDDDAFVETNIKRFYPANINLKICKNVFDGAPIDQLIKKVRRKNISNLMFNIKNFNYINTSTTYIMTLLEYNIIEYKDIIDYLNDDQKEKIKILIDYKKINV